MLCPTLSFRVAGAEQAEPVAVRPEGKQLWFSRCHPDNACEGFQAQADSATRGADGETLTLTGKVQLCLWRKGHIDQLRLWRDPYRDILATEQVVVNLRTNKLQSYAGAAVPSEGRQPLPPYTVEPPDVLSINAVSMQPKSAYRIEPGEVLKVQITGDDENHLLAGEFTVASDGTIDLGPAYGTIHVAGMTLAEAETAIRRHLKRSLHAHVSLSLSQPRSRQQVSGEHLIRPDGTIGLGAYGSLHVAGMTVAQVKAAVEEYLGEFADGVEVSVDVTAYNSKVCYVISDHSGSGEMVQRVPLTGNETVLDAIANTPDLHLVSRCRIWVARASEKGKSPLLLPVDWRGITHCGEMATNYALEPGDRLYVKKRVLIPRD